MKINNNPPFNENKKKFHDTWKLHKNTTTKEHHTHTKTIQDGFYISTHPNGPTNH